MDAAGEKAEEITDLTDRRGRLLTVTFDTDMGFRNTELSAVGLKFLHLPRHLPISCTFLVNKLT